MSINKVILVGFVGKDAEFRSFPNGDGVCNFSVATTDRYKDKASGEMKELTEWHRISCFGKLSTIAHQLVKKGSQVYIEGKISTRKWKDASGVEKFSTEIKADVMQMLSKEYKEPLVDTVTITQRPSLSLSNIEGAIPF